jgi:hypothetical protein
MNIVGSTEARIRDVKVTADIITAYLIVSRWRPVRPESWRVVQGLAERKTGFFYLFRRDRGNLSLA